jgi:site-specific DNA recombinase
VNLEEAKSVQKLFQRYLELGCVSRLKAELDREGRKSKVRISAAGKSYGGANYARGGLYKILKNRIYIGEICHKGKSHRGKHQAIISQELWDRVQARLRSDHQGHRNGVRASAPSLLVGMVRDTEGNRFTPSHAVKNGKRYRYYVCQPGVRNPELASRSVMRLPAHDLEDLISARVASFLHSPSEIIDQLGVASDQPERTRELLAAAQNKAKAWTLMSPSEHSDFLRKVIQTVVVQENEIILLLCRQALRELLGSDSQPQPATDDALHSPLIRLNIPAKLKRFGGEVRLMIPPGSHGKTNSRPSIPLINAIARAHDWHGRIINRQATNQRELAKQAGVDHTYVGRILRLAFLAPDIVEAILAGHQPPELTLLQLRDKLPLSWEEQRTILGLAK